MPIVDELLPPWYRLTEAQEIRRLNAIRRLQYLMEHEPEVLAADRKRKMERFDELPRSVRLLIHEYGNRAWNLFLAGTPPHLIEVAILAERRQRDFTFLELEL